MAVFLQPISASDIITMSVRLAFPYLDKFLYLVSSTYDIGIGVSSDMLCYIKPWTNSSNVNKNGQKQIWHLAYNLSYLLTPVAPFTSMV